MSATRASEPQGPGFKFQCSPHLLLALDKGLQFTHSVGYGVEGKTLAGPGPQGRGLRGRRLSVPHTAIDSIILYLSMRVATWLWNI